MGSKPLIKEALLLLDICGLNPTNQNIWTRTRTILLIVTLTNSFVGITTEYIVNWSGWNTIEEFIVWASFYQMSLKLVWVITKRKKYAHLIVCFNELWLLENFDSDFQKEINQIYSLGLIFVNFFAGGGLLSVTDYFVKPFFAKHLMLPYKTYPIGDITVGYIYWINYIVQLYAAIFGCLCVFGFDLLFMSFIVHLICQIKMIKKMFSKLELDIKGPFPEEAVLKKLNAIIEHHGLILRYIKHLNKAYSILLMHQFSISLCTFGASLLSMVARGFPPTLKYIYLHGVFFVTVLVQLLIYCLAGTLLTSESESLSETVYESYWWYKPQPKLRRAYTMVILRANRLERLTAGGMFRLDSETFTKILRASLSFLTLVQAMFNRIGGENSAIL